MIHHLAAVSSPPSPATPPLHPHPDPDPRRCRALVTSTGEQCRGWRVHDAEQPLCAGHLGRGIAADPRRYGIRGSQAALRTKEERQQVADQRRRGIAAALRVRVAEHAEQVIDALLAPVLDESLSPLQRQRAAMEVWSRAYGRPGTSDHVADGQEVAELGLDQLARLWAAEQDAAERSAGERG